MSLYFNICGYTNHKCTDGDSDYGNSVNSNDTCHHYSDSSISHVAVSFIDSSYPDFGVSLVYTYGDYCTESEYYTLTL